MRMLRSPTRFHQFLHHTLIQMEALIPGDHWSTNRQWTTSCRVGWTSGVPGQSTFSGFTYRQRLVVSSITPNNLFIFYFIAGAPFPRSTACEITLNLPEIKLGKNY